VRVRVVRTVPRLLGRVRRSAIGTALSGNWFESRYRQGGKVSGQNINGVIEAKVESDTITALLTVRTRGNRQTFVMDSPGAWVSHVSIDLVRDPDEWLDLLKAPTTRHLR
jgi:hypothetical protein